MNNPTWKECIEHLKAGGEVAVERISDDDYDSYFDIVEFIEVFPEEDYESDAAERKFELWD